MIQNLTELTFALIGLISLIFVVLFLPAFLELKKPKDNGPRVIPEIAPLQNSKIVFSLRDIDYEQKSGILLLHRIASILAVLPDLEV